jgi:hypothetical protein
MPFDFQNLLTRRTLEVRSVTVLLDGAALVQLLIGSCAAAEV